MDDLAAAGLWMEDCIVLAGMKDKPAAQRIEWRESKKWKIWRERVGVGKKKGQPSVGG